MLRLRTTWGNLEVTITAFDSEPRFEGVVAQ